MRNDDALRGSCNCFFCNFFVCAACCGCWLDVSLLADAFCAFVDVVNVE